MSVSLEDLEIIEKSVFEKADQKYVSIAECNEKQETVNGKFAKDDKRIDLLLHDFNIIKRFIRVTATATIGCLIAEIFSILKG